MLDDALRLNFFHSKGSHLYNFRHVLFLFLDRSLCFDLLVHTFIAIDAPGGFLFEWWSVFWDIFIARTNEKHSEAAAAYIEVC